MAPKEAAKKKKGLIIAAALLAVALFAITWTMRPRSWPDITGESDLDSVTLTVYGTGRWSLSWLGNDSFVIPHEQALLDVLNHGTYKGSPLNIFRPKQVSSVKGSTGRIELLLFKRGGSYLDVKIHSNGQVFIQNEEHIIRAYQTEATVYNELASILQKYGTFQERN